MVSVVILLFAFGVTITVFRKIFAKVLTCCRHYLLALHGGGKTVNSQSNAIWESWLHLAVAVWVASDVWLSDRLIIGALCAHTVFRTT